MMINALNHIQKIEHELITFSDDMDGLRKVPENIPNDKILKENLGKPLTSIPDPFKKYNSFGEHNNEMLKQFLNKFNLNLLLRALPKIIKRVSSTLLDARFRKIRRYYEYHFANFKRRKTENLLSIFTYMSNHREGARDTNVKHG